MVEWGDREWVWIRPHMTVEEREGVAALAERRGTTLSAVAREFVERALDDGRDGIVPGFVRAANDAGSGYNSAVRTANTVSRRYGFPLLLTDEEYEALRAALRSVAREAAEAGDAAGALPRVGASLGIVALPMGGDRGRGRPERVGLRLRRELADRVAERTGDERGALSLFVRGAIVTGTLREREGQGGRRYAFATEWEIRRFMIARARWETNREQAARALAEVRRSQCGSRYLSRPRALEVASLCDWAREATDAAASVAAARFDEVAGAVVGWPGDAPCRS